MAASAETKAYIAEVKTATVQSAAVSREAIRVYGEFCNKVAEQMAVLARKLQAAEMAETDLALDQILAEAFMRIGAVRTTQAELVRHLRDLAIREAALAAVNERVVARAAEL